LVINPISTNEKNGVYIMEAKRFLFFERCCRVHLYINKIGV